MQRGGRAFSRNCRLYVANADGSGERILPKITLCDDDPSWAPDGRRLAFSGRLKLARGGRVAAIHIVGTDGKGATRITYRKLPKPRKGAAVFPDDIDPVWSPTGNALAFTRARALFARSVFRVNADGTGLKALLVATKARSYETPDWAPDGSRLAVTMRRLVAAAHPPFVVTMNVDGTGQLLITPGGGLDPAWSPDQAKIVNAGRRDW